jgi:hypothetical protein
MPEMFELSLVFTFQYGNHFMFFLCCILVLGSGCWLFGSECELKGHSVSLEIDDRQYYFS